MKVYSSKLSIVKTIIVSFFLFSNLHFANAQKFGLNLELGAGVAQVGGDFLSGFNKSSTSIGISTPYKISNRMDFLVGLYHRQGGSKKKNESLPPIGQRSLVELSLSTMSLNTAIQYNYNENWDGSYKSYVRFGTDLSYLYNYSIDSFSSSGPDGEALVLKDSYVNVFVGLGRKLNTKFSLGVLFSYAITSLKQSPMDLNDLHPYQLMANLNYHIFD